MVRLIVTRTQEKLVFAELNCIVYHKKGSIQLRSGVTRVLTKRDDVHSIEDPRLGQVSWDTADSNFSLVSRIW